VNKKNNILFDKKNRRICYLLKKVKIVSFDIDGTLVDPEYNDLIWFKEIPQLISKKRQIPFKDAARIALQEYDNLGNHNLNWYDIEY